MAMDERTTGTRDEHYDVVSVLYHALQGAETCTTYLRDAERAGDQELVQFFREVQEPTGSWLTGARGSCGNGCDRKELPR